MSRELERLLQSVCEVVHEREQLIQAMAAQRYVPAEEAERLKLILTNAIADYERFYIRRSIAEERTLSATQVAARYGLKPAWVYHCAELQAIAFKVGKYLRYRESDLLKFEKERQKNQEDGRMHGYHLDSLIRHISERTTTGQNRTRFITKEPTHG